MRGEVRGDRGTRERGRGGVLVLDWLAVVYLASTGLLAAASGEALGLGLAVAHLSAAAFILRWGDRLEPRCRVRAAGAREHIFRFFRAVYPVALTPLLYQEVSVLNGLLVSGFFDATVQGWEEAVFGVQLSVEASRWIPSRWVSEILHLGYGSYYVLVPGAAIAVYRSAGARALHRLAVATGLAFFGCYVIFVLFPVQGPRYVFSPISGAAAGGPVHGVVHWILEHGSSRGTAFPSSHVAAALASWLASRRAAPGWFRWSAPFVWLLTLGTVYGGFHYGVDAVAGLAAGAAAWALTPALLRGGREPDTPEGAHRQPSGRHGYPTYANPGERKSFGGNGTDRAGTGG